MPVGSPGSIATITEITQLEGTLKGRIFNTAVLANTDFFAADLHPTQTPLTSFRVYVALDTAGIFSVRRTSAGATVGERTNQGNSLNANAAYVFDVIVHEDDTINFQTDTAATILYCIVIEVPGMIS